MSRSALIGKLGEQQAVRYLKKEGLSVCCRNYRTRNGEIDIIARDGDTWVFCEVKTRSGLDFGTPAEAVGFYKIQALQRTALMYLQQQRIFDAPVRFDVIEVLYRDGKPCINHIRSAF